METIYLNVDQLASWQEKAKRCVIALGFFDGVHKGHCEVIHTAANIARTKNLSLAVMSFFPHPKTIISNKKIHYLMPLSEKKKKLQELGVDLFYIVEFNKEFASLPPAQFVVQYLINLGVSHAVAGFDYTYGFRGMGNMSRLKEDSGGLIDVTTVEKLDIDGEKVSSTLIREKLIQGKVDDIPPFLGRPYKIDCVWDEKILKPMPYYTLPAPGYYEVTLKNPIGSIRTEIKVLKAGADNPFICMTEIPQYMTGSLSIVWHRAINERRIFGWSHYLLNISERKQLLNIRAKK